MRYVTVQEPVTLLDENDKPITEPDPLDRHRRIDAKPVDHHRFLMAYVVNEGKVVPAAQQGAQPTVAPKIGVGYEGFKRTGKLDRAFRSAQPGAVIAIEDEDWKVVKTILEEKDGIFPSIGAQLMPFFSSWMDAPDKRPEVNGEARPLAQVQA